MQKKMIPTEESSQRAYQEPKRRFETAGTTMPEESYYVERMGVISEEGENVMYLIKNHRFFTISAPRQTGKTTLIHEICQKLNQEEKHIAIHLDFQGFEDDSFFELQELFDHFQLQFFQKLYSVLEIRNEGAATRFSEFNESSKITSFHRFNGQICGNKFVLTLQNKYVKLQFAIILKGKTMTPRERVLATFEGRTTDKIPVHNVGFTGYAASVILGREAYVGGEIQQWREMKALWEGPDAHREFAEKSAKDAIDVALACEHDILRLQYWRWSGKPTKKIDEYTFLFGDPEKSWYTMRFEPEIELFIRTGGYGSKVIQKRPPKGPTEKELETLVTSQEKSLEDYHPSENADPSIQATLAKYKDYVVRNWGVSAGISREPYWLEATALRPDLVARYVNVQAERAVRQIPRLAASGVKLLFGGGDFASNEGPMYSPKAFHDITLPVLKKITEACHKHGVYYLFASDGNLWPVADDLFDESGVDGFYEIDRRASMDLRKLRERFPHLTLIGNISSHTLHLGTQQQVIDEVLSCIDVAEKFGRVIIGTSNYIMPGTPEENIHALLDTIHKYRG